MKKILLIVLSFFAITLFLSFIPKKTDNIQGEIVWIGKRCDYYLVETSSHFIIVEDYSNKYYDIGDIVFGDFHSYGFKNISNAKKKNEQKIYIENYHSTSRKCFEWITSKTRCE